MSDAKEGQQHPLTVYLWIWLLLFVLSTFSYLVDYFHLQGYLRWSLIITFMLLKAGFIVAIFMHMAWERLAQVRDPVAAAVPADSDRLHGDRGRLHLPDAGRSLPSLI
jgi:cytochrome c oxidase subunit IV